MSQPWLRQVVLEIGKLPDWMQDTTFTVPAIPLAARIVSDGTQNTLRIKFSLHKHYVNTGQPSTISIYNLGPGVRDALLASSGNNRMGATQLNLYAGWSQGTTSQGPIVTKDHLLISGGLWAAWSHREGADIVTNLMTLPEAPSFRGVVNTTYDPNTPVITVVTDLAMMIPGITKDLVLVNIPAPLSIGSRGYTCKGDLSSELEKLARVYGFTWHILDGVFEASMDATPIGYVVKVSSANGFLKHIDPMLNGIDQQQVGVTIHTLLNPLINPFRVVEAKSSVTPKLSGDYFAMEVHHNGDTASDVWDTVTECRFIIAGDSQNTQSQQDPPSVTGVGVNAIDAAGISFIQDLEGPVMTTVQYVNGLPHIGWSHYLSPQEFNSGVVILDGQRVSFKSGLSGGQIQSLFMQDLLWRENGINSSVKVPLKQSQFNALCSIAYNTNYSGHLDRDLLIPINQGNFSAAGMAILTYRTTARTVSHGVVTHPISPVLIARRVKEANLWNS